MTNLHFSRGRGETLDEAIDRVAAQLTAVSPDLGFTARLNARLDRTTTVSLGSATGVVIVAAAVVVLMVIVSRLDHEPQTRLISPAQVAAVTEPPPAPAGEVVARVQPEMRRATHRATPPDEVQESIPMIPALTGPETLSVAALTFESLSIAPIELDTLDLADLDVRELDSGEPAKDMR